MSAEPRATQPLIIHLGPVLQRLSDRDFFDFCQLNQDLCIERTSDGDLVIMHRSDVVQTAPTSLPSRG